MTFLHGWAVQQKLHFTRLWAFSWAQTWLFHSVDLWESTSISVQIGTKEQQIMYVKCSRLPYPTIGSRCENISNSQIYHICHTPHLKIPYPQLIQKVSKVVGRSSPPPPEKQSSRGENQTHHNTKGSIGIGLFAWKLNCFEVAGTSGQHITLTFW